MHKNLLNLGLVLAVVFALIACEKKNTSETLSGVTDSANVLSAAHEIALAEQLRELEQTVGSQVAILLIDTLNGVPIERYSFNIASKWGLGRKGYNDGLLITASFKDRSFRIEVGRGLEKIIKDEIAAEIIRDSVVPYFRNDQYYQGLASAVERIKELIKSNRDLIGE